jgi:hypothetical protein
MRKEVAWDGGIVKLGKQVHVVRMCVSLKTEDGMRKSKFVLTK